MITGPGETRIIEADFLGWSLASSREKMRIFLLREVIKEFSLKMESQRIGCMDWNLYFAEEISNSIQRNLSCH
jgi:hypothetical protein